MVLPFRTTVCLLLFFIISLGGIAQINFKIEACVIDLDTKQCVKNVSIGLV